MAIVMAIGWYFFDRNPEDPAFDPAKISDIKFGSIAPKFSLPAIAVIAAVPMAWSAFVMDRTSVLPEAVDLPKVAGWEIVPYEPTTDWKPRFDGGSHYLFGRYRNAAGAEVDLFAVVYDRQDEGREVVGFGQGAVNPDSEWAWTENLTAPANAKAERIKAPGPVVRDVLSFYRINGTTTGSATKVKLETLKARLFAGSQQTVGIVLSSEFRNGVSQRATLDGFVNDLGEIDKVADRMAGLD